MKILVFTTLYDTSKRPDLKVNTSAVHYFLKYLSKENDILVINTYVSYKKDILRYFKPKNLKNYFSDYYYEIDNVNVCIVDIQTFNDGYMSNFNWKRLKKHVDKILKNKNFNPDIIVSHFPSFSFKVVKEIPATKNKIAILHQTDLNQMKRNPKIAKGISEIYTYTYARSKKILQDAKIKYQIKNIEKDLIYSGVPITNIGNANRNFNKKEPKKILYVGKLIKRKNLDWLIESLSKFDNNLYKLTIVGKGPEEKNIKNLLYKKDMLKNVEFIESMPREQVLIKMDESDIFCMPSINETFGLVYTEAMSRGCLTIALKNEGIDGVIVDKNNGFLVKDIFELEECLNDIFFNYDSEFLKKISQEAIKTVSNMTEEKMADKYYELISK